MATDKENKKNDAAQEPAAQEVTKQPINKDKLEALKVAMERIEKNFGKGALINMQSDEVEDISVVPSGSLNLDIALGIGGYPRGRIVEIFGQESSGKTTLAIHAIAEAQKLGGLTAIIDAEHAFDPSYAQALGVDMERLWISQPDNGEQALEIAEQLIRSSAVDIVVIDSVAALTPKLEIEGGMGERNVGMQARLMSQALRKMTAAVSRSNTVCIFINQLREKIATSYGPSYGPNEVTTGGNALKFYSSVRLEIRRRQQLKRNSDEAYGNETLVKVVKNKLAPPFRTAFFEILYGEGISKEGEIIDKAVEMDIIKKSGSWYSYGDTRLGQGKDAVRALLKDNVELTEELYHKIMEQLQSDKKNKK